MFGDSFYREPRTGFHLRRYTLDGATWDVAVALPDGPAPVDGFPLLLVTDGALHFDAAAAAARALARRPLKTDIGPSIVVGIASGIDWSHDPARREAELRPDGADNATLRRLLPLLLADIAALAPVEPERRAIMGHSFGGLFALDAIARVPEGFTACIAISPSIWNAPDLPARVAGALSGRNARILLVSGEREPRINADLPAATATLAATQVTLPCEDHGSIVFAALPLALRFLHGTVRQD